MLDFFSTFWIVLCQLAPWLLLGMALSGLLHAFLPQGFVKRRFRGPKGVASAVTLGIPLPLCSCGVVPAGIGLKNDGASDGAAVGFLISTPQTGIDSILVSASFFGWPFAIFKMLAALVTGLAGGLLAEGFDRTDEKVDAEANDSSKAKPTIGEAFSHAMDILGSIWVWLVVGVLISAAIESWGPEAWVKSIESIGLFPAMLLVLLISTPLYVCATASVPIAASLVSLGLPPGAAMVFLMAGPATNVTTLGAVYSRFGVRTLAVYLGSILVGSMTAAWLFDWLLTANIAQGDGHHNHNVDWLTNASGILLSLMIGWIFIAGLLKRSNQKHVSGKTFSVEGLHCQNCVGKLEKALKRLPGVNEAQVDLNEGHAIVSGDFTSSEIENTIREAGFVPR